MNKSHSGVTMGKTWIEPEEWAYNNSFGRAGYVRVRANEHAPSFPIALVGQYRSVRVNIPDTYFSIPARLSVNGKRVKGFVSVDSEAGEFTFTPEAEASK